MIAKISTKFMASLKNFHFLGAQINLIAYSKVKNMMTAVSMYSKVRLKVLLGSISWSSLKSSRVERMKVKVDTMTIPREKNALI